MRVLFGAGWCCLLVSACTRPNPAALVADETGDETSEAGTTATGTTTGSDTTTGLDTTSAATTTDDDTDTETTGPTVECPKVTHRCVAAVPDTWKGPILVDEASIDEPVSACPSGYPVEGPTVYADPHVPTATCSCACKDPVGMTCPNLSLNTHTDSMCMSSTRKQYALPPNTCVDIGTDHSARFAAPPVPIKAGTGQCLPDPVQNIPQASWTMRAARCGGATVEDGCADDQLCVPTIVAPFDLLCIWADGDVPCPVGSTYAQRSVYHHTLADRRSCTTCSCDDPTGSCGGSVDLIEQCVGGLKLGEVETGACSSAIFNVRGAKFTPEPIGSCAAVGGELEGEVTTLGPVTYCCHPL